MNSGPDDSMTISQRAGDILMAPGSCYRPNAMYHVVWEALPELYNREGGADGVLTRTRDLLSNPVSRPQTAEGETRVRPA